MKKASGYSHAVEAAAACFAVGVVTGWWLHAGGPVRPVRDVKAEPRIAAAPPAAPANAGASVGAAATASIGGGEGPPLTAATSGTASGTAIDELRKRNLRLPLDEVRVDSLQGDFDERRSKPGAHQHEAADMLAARNTPIHAVDDGTVVRLFLSKAGGQTIYQFDPTSRFCYYYAHLERYASGLAEGQAVKRGDVIGYVGTSGNAPPGTPHLHFAVFVLGPEKNWWQGAAVDPYLVFKK